MACEISPRGLIVADRDTLMTSAPGVFAGGDCVFGPRLIIDSVGDGKRIAAGIDEYLTGRKRPEPEIEVEVLDHHRMFADFMNLTAQPVPMLPLDRRTGVTEVEIGFDEESAMREARRCLRCWINTVFEGNEAGRIAMHPVRRLRGCLSRGVPSAGAAGADRLSARGARADPRQRAALPRGTGRRGGRRAGHHHRLGHAQGRNALHPLRPVRRAMPGAT